MTYSLSYDTHGQVECLIVTNENGNRTPYLASTLQTRLNSYNRQKMDASTRYDSQIADVSNLISQLVALGGSTQSTGTQS